MDFAAIHSINKGGVTFRGGGGLPIGESSNPRSHGLGGFLMVTPCKGPSEQPPFRDRPICNKVSLDVCKRQRAIDFLQVSGFAQLPPPPFTLRLTTIGLSVELEKGEKQKRTRFDPIPAFQSFSCKGQQRNARRTVSCSQPPGYLGLLD